MKGEGEGEELMAHLQQLVFELQELQREGERERGEEVFQCCNAYIVRHTSWRVLPRVSVAVLTFSFSCLNMLDSAGTPPAPGPPEAPPAAPAADIVVVYNRSCCLLFRFLHLFQPRPP